MFRVLGTQSERQGGVRLGVDVQGAGDTETQGGVRLGVDVQGAGDTETQGGVRLGGGCSGCWGQIKAGSC